MEELVSFMAKGLVSYPDDVRVNAVEGESVMILELDVHPDDADRVIGDNGRTIRAMRQVLSAASGRRKTVLELLEPATDGAEE